VRGDRELIPAEAVQKSSIQFLVSTDTIGTPGAPLLEEERDLLSHGLAPDAINPFRAHRTGFSPTLASDNDPMNASQVDRADILEEWLNRQKTHRGFDTSEMVNSGQAVSSVFY
jgi:hypothetical protein